MHSTNSADGTSLQREPSKLTSLQDLTIIEAWDSMTSTPKYVTFYFVSEIDELYFGQSSKNKRDMTLAEYSAALQHVPDEEIYPEVPEESHLKVASQSLDDSSAYVKRPGLNSYEIMKGTNYIPKVTLNETLIMERLSKSPHPNIIHYHGCRVRRGRITAIVLERLDQTLTQFATTPSFQHLDRIPFFRAIESAVGHVHDMGLAHNDINPDNVMIKNDMPVLIDFGSCQPFGMPLQSLGTEGWYEETFFTSEKKHDTFSLGKLREWLQISK